MRRVLLLIGLLMLGLYFVVKPPDLVTAGKDRGPVELSAPAGDLPTHINAAGETVLPNGRLITPQGVRVTVSRTLTAWHSVLTAKRW